MGSLLSFFSLSMVTSVSHYAFQLILARRMGALDYSSFSGLWAQLSVLLLFASWVQYWSTLTPLRPTTLKKLVFAGYVLSLLSMTFAVCGKGMGYLFFAIILISAVHGLFCGRALAHREYSRMSFTNLIAAGGRLILILALPEEYITSFAILSVVYFSYIASHLVFLRSSVRGGVAIDVQSNISGSVLLAFITVSFPVSDILWAQLFHSSEELLEMAPVSLITRGLFYVQMIFAQWWLPRRIEGPLSITFVNFRKYLLISVFGSVILSLGFRLTIQEFLGWTAVPSLLTFFLASLNAILMVLNFNLIQYLVLRNLTGIGAFGIGVLVLGWFTLGLVPLPVNGYLVGMIFMQLLALSLSQRSVSRISEKVLGNS